MNPVSLLALAAGSVVLAHGSWWTLLSLAALKRPGLPVKAKREWKFVVVVPAHDEELLVASTVASLLAARFRPRPEVLVVADNCTDGTAEVARAAGATVLVRTDPARRGKSFALDFAIESLAARGEMPEALLFVDADTTVSSNLFEAVASRLECGAGAVQVHYAAAGSESELARLRRLAFLLVHWARPLGAARLGLGTSLKGNGMAMPWDVVRDGLGGAGLVEDAATSLWLARRGIAVRFEPSATVWGQMAASYEDAAVQDRRWEGGRFALMRDALGVTATAVVRGRIAVAAGALEVASPPLTVLGGLAVIVVIVGAAGLVPIWLALAAPASLVASAATGWLAARASPRDLVALARAPRFVLHKGRVYLSLLRDRAPRSWERTAR